MGKGFVVSFYKVKVSMDWLRNLLDWVGQIGYNHSMFLLVKLILGVAFAFSSNFVPDEFWQTTEVAYRMTFYKGHLTWEWLVGIRSFIVPAVISGLYSIGQYVGLQECAVYLMIAPQFLQGIFSLRASMLYFQFCVLRMGLQTACLAYVFFLMNWFTLYCCARTITNQTEMSLNCFCLWYLQTGKYKRFVFCLCMNFMIRPTAALFWIPFIPEVLMKLRLRQVFTLTGIAIVTLVYGAAMDSMMYRKITVTWWEFFKFNVWDKGSEEFGVHHKLWYFYSGLPSILGPLYVFLPAGLFFRGDLRMLSSYVLIYITALSFIGHKEIRFLLPVLPLVFLVIGAVANKLYVHCRTLNLLQTEESRRRVGNFILVALAIVNMIAAFFIGIMHLRGLRAASMDINTYTPHFTKIPAVWVITPCYSLPIHTYMPIQRAKYIYYVCPPKRFMHFYDFRGTSPIIMQNGSFADQNVKRDLKIKLKYQGPPDYVIAFDYTGHHVMNVLEGAGYEYFPKRIYRHTYFGEFGRNVIVHARYNKTQAMEMFEEVKEYVKRRQDMQKSFSPFDW